MSNEDTIDNIKFELANVTCDKCHFCNTWFELEPIFKDDLRCKNCGHTQREWIKHRFDETKGDLKRGDK